MSKGYYTRLAEEIKRRVPFDQFFAELYPDHYQGRSSLCPFHDDHKESFEVHEDHGFDHAGCTPPGNNSRRWSVIDLWMRYHDVDFKTAVRELAQKYNITLPEDKPRKRGRIVETYDFTTETREPLFQEVRLEPKGFKCRRPDPDRPGEWIWDLKGVNLCLYNLPGIATSDTVAVVEGPKDADALNSLGICATTAPLGAGKWPKLVEKHCIHEPLKGKNVVIYPDNDPQGQKHAVDIARSSHGFAASVKIIELPGLPLKGDVSDFIEKQGPEEATRRLLELAQAAPEYKPSPEPDQGDGENDEERPRAKPSKFKKALQTYLDTGSETFLDQHNTGYTCIDTGKGLQNVRLASSAFNRHMLLLFVSVQDEGINRETITQVADFLEASADHTRHLFNRLVVQDNRIMIDLGTLTGEVLEIVPGDYQVVSLEQPPFKRYSHQQALPTPVPGGDLRELLSFLPVTDEDTQILLLVWLVTALIANIARPGIILHGIQGSAKTTVAEVLRSLLDPSSTPTLSLSKDHGEFVQLLDHHAIIVLDNLHRLPQWASDDLCRAVTAGGFSKRRLYSDDDDVIYQFARTFIANGINIPGTSPDLLDRSILVPLNRIPEERRRPKEELVKKFEEARPRLFGAMVAALSRAMQIIDSVQLDRLPRMADWCRWGCAVAETLGIGQDRFLDAYHRNIGSQNDEVVNNDLVCGLVMDLMEEKEEWSGRPGELYQELSKLAEDQGVHRERRWPKSPQAFSRRLNEMSHNLREAGIVVDRGTSGRGRRKRKTITISWSESTPESSAPSTDRPQTNDIKKLGGADEGSQLDPQPDTDRQSDPANQLELLGGAHGDHGAANSGKLSPLDLQECSACQKYFRGSCGYSGNDVSEMQYCPRVVQGRGDDMDHI